MKHFLFPPSLFLPFVAPLLKQVPTIGIRCLERLRRYFPSSSRQYSVFIKLKRARCASWYRISRTRLGTVEKQPWHKLASMGMKTTVLHFSWPLVALTFASVTRKNRRVKFVLSLSPSLPPINFHSMRSCCHCSCVFISFYLILRIYAID